MLPLPIDASTLRPLRAARPRLAIAVLATLGALLVPGQASAAPALSIAAVNDPVESLTTQLGVSGSPSNTVNLVVLSVKPAGGPGCAANYAADSGSTVVDKDERGAFSESANWTFDTAGNYLLCAWLQDTTVSGAPVVLSASSTITVRPPHTSIAISAPPTAAVGATFQVGTLAQTEASRLLYVTVVPDTGRGCAANASAAGGNTLVDKTITGGPTPFTVNDSISTPGTYLICGYFQYRSESDPPEGVGQGSITIVPPCVIPSVAGIGRAKASAAIVAAHCSVGAVTKTTSAKYKKGKVVRTNRKAGSTLPNGAAVGIVVSSGHPKAKKKRHR